jgi:hypothetical protein
MHTLDELADDGLERVVVACRRDVEDGIRVKESSWVIERAREVQLARFRLRMRYGAGEPGTDSYDRWYRFDDAPSYRLAAAVDFYRARAGRSHVLAWPEARAS